jgi:glycosyltransferase involved in cell wall biosynthesis
VLRVALDVTPLIGARTGVGMVTAGMAGALTDRPDIHVSPYALTWRGRDSLQDAGVGSLPRWPMAARPLRRIWQRLDVPPIEWWTGPVDVVHGPNYVVPPARRAARVVSVHDLTFLHHPEMCTADVLEYREILRRSTGQGAWVHTAAHHVAEEIVAAFPAAEGRVRVVAHGVDPITPAAGPSPHSFPYVLALGTVEPRKDLPTLVEAFGDLAARHPDLRLVVAGPDGWGVEAYDRAVAACPHRDRIIREGYVDAPRRASLLTHAAAFAYPSVYEGFGLPPLEAMTVGTPVVSSSAGPLPEVLGDGAVLVPPRDPAALAGALDEVIADDERRQDLADRGRSWVARYTWAACGDGLAGLYGEAVSAR